MGNASFYRKAFKDTNNVWMTYDYYISGNIQMKSPYKSKKLKKHHGKVTYYYENGNKSYEVKYINDLKDGEFTRWYETGEVEQKGGYKKEVKSGTWQGWYQNGQQSYSKYYHKGKEEDTSEYFYESGELEEKNNWIDNSTFLCEGFHENGVLHYSGEIKFDKKNGKWTYWNDDGKIKSEGNFKNGYKDGIWIRYFKEEKIELLFRNGKREGEQFGGVIRRK